MTAAVLDDIISRLGALSPDAKQSVVAAALSATKHMPWVPNVGPQTDGFFCEADELFYGGQAGGGKTDLLLGLALCNHRRSLILRRTNKEAEKLPIRLQEILGNRDGWNGQRSTWTLPTGATIETGGVQLEDDKQKHKGFPHDLIGWDEVSDFTETQFRFVNAWNRSADPEQRCRVVAAGNPPTRAEGLWVIKYWAPWLDPTHPNPAKPGELRWFTTIAGEDREVDGPGPHIIPGESRPVLARSRTFIPSELSDNPDLARTNYSSVLSALPPALRAAYRDGNFSASLKDEDFQVVPTAWIEAAQARWTPDGHKAFAMTAMALDPAGGGRDSAELCWRHGGWYAPIISAQGEETADGSASAGTIVRYRRDNAPVVIDVGGGYGGAVSLRLKDNGVWHLPFNGANASLRKTKDGLLRFANKRAEAWWRFREELDPDQEGGCAIALPPDPELKADLAAPTFEVSARGILIESKEDLRKRIGRSPGKGDAAVMCLSEGNTAVRKHLTRSFTPNVVLKRPKN